ncbi:unnamed protein product [Rotaria sordida]|uniref:Uncharacterized protein n=1 Tax=Rotaria sordida TaxID=392033 RepID=A0A815FFA3_9BILA|nr:unnamed protein product [Rotaria sordida]CAF1322755.1 unnamed protein product [Rotaria sordida]
MFLTCQTNRTFSENYSIYTKDLFNRFQKYLQHNYEHLWTKNHQDMLISIKPQQIEFDILSFEHIPNDIQLIEAIKTKLHELKQIIIENNENEEECHRSKLLNDNSSSNSDAEQIPIALTLTHEVPLENLSNTPHQSDNENEEEQARQVLLEQNNSSEHEDDDTILLKPSICLKRILQTMLVIQLN